MLKRLKKLFLLVVAVAIPAVLILTNQNAIHAEGEVTKLWTQPNDTNDPMVATTGIFKASDGGYYVTGQSYAQYTPEYNSGVGYRATVLKLDANGNKQWTAKAGYSGGSFFTSVAEVSANEIVAVGYDIENKAVFSRFTISNNVATTTEDLSYAVTGDNLQTTFGTVLIDDDNNFVISGSSQNTNNGKNRTVFVMKLNNNHACTVSANTYANPAICDEDIVYTAAGTQTSGWSNNEAYIIPKMIKTDDDTYIVSTASIERKGLIKVEEINNSDARVVLENGGTAQTRSAGSMGVASAANKQYVLIHELLNGHLPIKEYQELTDGNGNSFLRQSGGGLGDWDGPYASDSGGTYYKGLGVITTVDGEYLVYGSLTDSNASTSNSTLMKINGATYGSIWQVTEDVGIGNQKVYEFTGAVSAGNGVYVTVDNQGVVRAYQDNTSYHHISYHIVGDNPFSDAGIADSCTQSVRTSAVAGTTFGELENYSECEAWIHWVNNERADYANRFAGYTFDGWYTDENFTTKFSESNIVADRDIDLYGRYTKKSYTLPFYVAVSDPSSNETEFIEVDSQVLNVGDEIVFPNVDMDDTWENPDSWYGAVTNGDEKTINDAIKTGPNQDHLFTSQNVMLMEKAAENPDALVGWNDDAVPIQERYYDSLVMKVSKKTSTVNYNYTNGNCYPGNSYARSGSETIAYGDTFDVSPVITENKQCYLTNLQSSTDGQNWTDFNPATPITEDIQIKGQWMQNYLVVKNDQLQYADGTAFSTSDAGGIEYNPSTNTLALNNYVSEIGSSYCASGAYEIEFNCFLPVKIENGDEPVTVIFNGSNDLSNGGLHSTSPLILAGDGSLSTRNSYERDVTSTSSIVIENGEYYCYEIVATGNLIVNGGDYNISHTIVEPDDNDSATLVVSDANFDTEDITMNGKNNSIIISGTKIDEMARIVYDKDNGDTLNLYVEDSEIRFTDIENDFMATNFIMDGGKVSLIGATNFGNMVVNDGELNISSIIPMKPALTITESAVFNGGKTVITGGSVPMFISPEGDVDGPLVSFNGGEVILEVVADADKAFDYVVDEQVNSIINEMMRPEIDAMSAEISAADEDGLIEICTDRLDDFNGIRQMIGLEPYPIDEEQGYSVSCVENIKSDFPEMIEPMLAAYAEMYRPYIEEELAEYRQIIEASVARIVPIPIAVASSDESAIYIADNMNKDAYDTKPASLDDEEGRKPLVVSKINLGGNDFLTFGNGDGEVIVSPKIDEQSGEQIGFVAENAPSIVHIYGEQIVPPVPDTDDDEEGGEESKENPGASDTGFSQFGSSTAVSSTLISATILGIAGMMFIVYRRTRQTK